VLGAAVLLGGCADVTLPWSPPEPQVATPLSSLATDADTAPVVLYVSNQSFDDESVRMTVVVDGEAALDQDLEVRGQHDFLPVPLDLAPGPHDLVVTTDSGARSDIRLEVPPAPERRWVTILYWTEDRTRVDVDVHTEPVAFG
jgi:hypothetical protein